MTPMSDDERREWWHTTGSMTPAGDFKRQLHLFTMGRIGTQAIVSIDDWETFPWVEWSPRPDLSEITARYNIAEWEGMPDAWQDFWICLGAFRSKSQDRPGKTNGPYWMLLNTASKTALAQQIVGMKRRIINEIFKKPQTTTWATQIGATNACVDERIREAMEPFKVMSPQQELEDETNRLGKISTSAVSQRYGSTFNRPPRCR